MAVLYRHTSAPTGPPARRRAPPGPAIAPHGRLTAAALRLWLPRLPAAAEGPNGRAWRRRARATQQWGDLVRLALAAVPRPWPTWTAAVLRYDVYRPPGRPESDRDNLVIAVGKPVQDALVREHVLAGDGPDVVLATPVVEQHITPLWSGFTLVTVRPRPRRSP